MAPQLQRVLTHLQTKGSIQPLEAWTDLGVYRLSDVIFKLRENYNIETQPIHTVNRYAEKVSFANYVYIGEK